MAGALLEHVGGLLSAYSEVGPPVRMIRNVCISWRQDLTVDFDSSSPLAFEALMWSP